MNLNKLPKTTKKSKKRVGRGYASGKGGHTVGRGAKGLKARGKVPLTFDGTKIKKSFFQRLPLRRGKGKFKSFKSSPIIVNLKYLNLLPKNTVVDLDSLVKNGIVAEEEAKQFGVKILGEGDLTVSLKVSLPCSQGAVKKIEKAGGQIIKAPEKKAPRKEKSKAAPKKKMVRKVNPKKPSRKGKSK